MTASPQRGSNPQKSRMSSELRTTQMKSPQLRSLSFPLPNTSASTHLILYLLTRSSDDPNCLLIITFI